MLRPGVALRAAVLAAGLAVLLPVPTVQADDGLSTGAGVTCAPSTCDVAARSVTKGRRGSRPRSPRQRGEAPKPRHGGNAGPKGPAGPPTITSTGWEYDLGGDVGILPRFDADKQKKAKPDGEHGQVPRSLLIQAVVQRLRLPKPLIRTNPDEDFVQVVNVPTWLWVQHSTWRPVSVSAEAGGVTVWATARPRRAVWSMGDGGEVVCRGAGTPYSGRYSARKRSPDCGYTYRRASLVAPDRAYTVSVRVSWDVEWHGGGQSGVVRGMVMRAERRLTVAEVQAVVTR